MQKLIKNNIRDVRFGKKCVIVKPVNLYECELGNNVFIGPFVEIGKDVKVGNSTRISSHTFICPKVKIGKNCFIGHNTIIEKNVIIGNKCSIGSNVIIRNTIIKDNVFILDGCVIGKKGFGFFPNKNRNIKYPHIGMVIIGNNVEIGANSTIDRGTLDNTIICDGVKLDNQIMIGHNVVIGDHTAIVASTSIAGSSKKTFNSIEQAKSKSKNTVVIEKKTSKFSIKSQYPRPNNNNFRTSKNNTTKTHSINYNIFT